MEERRCHECGEKLKGRADQKFCTDACRNAYNNQKLGRTTNFMRRINRILKQNHAILETINTNGRTVTYKNRMVKKGFNFSYFTHVYRTGKGRIYYFCYDQGFAAIEKNRFLLIKREQD